MQLPMRKGPELESSSPRKIISTLERNNWIPRKLLKSRKDIKWLTEEKLNPALKAGHISSLEYAIMIAARAKDKASHSLQIETNMIYFIRDLRRLRNNILEGTGIADREWIGTPSAASPSTWENFVRDNPIDLAPLTHDRVKNDLSLDDDQADEFITDLFNYSLAQPALGYFQDYKKHKAFLAGLGMNMYNRLNQERGIQTHIGTVVPHLVRVYLGNKEK